MPTRIYEPPVDPSSIDIETVQTAQGRRQVLQAPETDAAIAALRASNEADSDAEQALLTAIRDYDAARETITGVSAARRQVVAANPDAEVRGVLAAVGDIIELPMPVGASSFNVQLAGTFSTGSTVMLEGLTGEGVWFPTNGRLNPMNAVGSSLGNRSTSTPAGPGPLHYRGSASAFSRFRVRCTALATGDQIAVTIRIGTATGGTFLIAGIPSGESFIGYIADYEARAVDSGRYRFAGVKAATSVTTPNASLTLINPLGSKQDLVLTRYQVEVDAAADVVLIEDATSTGTLSAQLNPNRSVSVASLAQVRGGAGVLTGGAVSSVVRRAQPNSPIAVGPFEWRITPGKTLTIRFLGPGATNNVWFNVGFFVLDEGGKLL